MMCHPLSVVVLLLCLDSYFSQPLRHEVAGRLYLGTAAECVVVQWSRRGESAPIAPEGNNVTRPICLLRVYTHYSSEIELFAANLLESLIAGFEVPSSPVDCGGALGYINGICVGFSKFLFKQVRAEWHMNDGVLTHLSQPYLVAIKEKIVFTEVLVNTLTSLNGTAASPLLREDFDKYKLQREDTAGAAVHRMGLAIGEEYSALQPVADLTAFLVFPWVATLDPDVEVFYGWNTFLLHVAKECDSGHARPITWRPPAPQGSREEEMLRRSAPKSRALSVGPRNGEGAPGGEEKVSLVLQLEGWSNDKVTGNIGIMFFNVDGPMQRPAIRKFFKQATATSLAACCGKVRSSRKSHSFKRLHKKLFDQDSVNQLLSDGAISFQFFDVESVPPYWLANSISEKVVMYHAVNVGYSKKIALKGVRNIFLDKLTAMQRVIRGVLMSAKFNADEVTPELLQSKRQVGGEKGKLERGDEFAKLLNVSEVKMPDFAGSSWEEVQRRDTSIWLRLPKVLRLADALHNLTVAPIAHSSCFISTIEPKKRKGLPWSWFDSPKQRPAGSYSPYPLGRDRDPKYVCTLRPSDVTFSAAHDILITSALLAFSSLDNNTFSTNVQQALPESADLSALLASMSLVQRAEVTMKHGIAGGDDESLNLFHPAMTPVLLFVVFTAVTIATTLAMGPGKKFIPTSRLHSHA